MKQSIKDLLKIFLIVTGIAFWLCVLGIWTGMITLSQPPATATPPAVIDHCDITYDSSINHEEFSSNSAYIPCVITIQPKVTWWLSPDLPTSTGSGEAIPYHKTFRNNNFIGAPGTLESQFEGALDASKGTACYTLTNGNQVIHDMSWNNGYWTCLAPTSTPCVEENGSYDNCQIQL